jgi:hypothetical protein
VHSSEKSDSQLPLCFRKSHNKERSVGCPREVRGECVRALTAGAHFLCGQNFEQADKISVSAIGPCAPRPGTFANHRRELPLVEDQKFHTCRTAPVSPSFICHLLLHFSITNAAEPLLGAAVLQPTLQRDIYLWRVSTCALTAFVRHLPNRKLRNADYAALKIRDHDFDHVILLLPLGFCCQDDFRQVLYPVCDMVSPTCIAISSQSLAFSSTSAADIHNGGYSRSPADFVRYGHERRLQTGSQSTCPILPKSRRP